MSDMQDKLRQIECQLSETHKSFLEEKSKTGKAEREKREYEDQNYKEKERRFVYFE